MSIGIGNPTGTNSRVTVRKVTFQALTEAVRISGNGWVVEGCFTTGTPWLAVDADLWTSAKIISNYTTTGGSVDLGDGTDHIVAGNTFESVQIIGGAAERCIVADNVILVGSVDTAPYIIGFNGASKCHITGNVIESAGEDGITLIGGQDNLVASNTLASDAVAGITLDGESQTKVDNNFIRYPLEHGILLDDAIECQVTDNMVWGAGQDGDNTFDGIHLMANSDRNTLMDNVVVSDTGIVETRYALNVSAATCNDTVYLGNRALGTFGTAAYNDAGTGTVNTWPAAGGAQGDNLL